MPKPGKYAYVEKSYNPDSEEEEDGGTNDAMYADDKKVASRRASVQCTLVPPVQRLMKLIFNQQYFAQTMMALNYDVNKLPLGKLSRPTIKRGFQALQNLAALFDDSSLAASEYGTSLPAAIEQCSNQYYSLIPHAFGRNRPPIIQNTLLLKKELELLESLGDMKDAAELIKSTLKDDGRVHPLNLQFNGLGMEEMKPVDQDSDEFHELSAYLTRTKGNTHNINYEIEDIFRIQRAEEFERFKKSPYSKSDRRLLWHGSHVTNFGATIRVALPCFCFVRPS